MTNTPKPSRSRRAFTALRNSAHVGMTMARRGLLVPGRPGRVVGQLFVLMRWGFSLAGGFSSAARRSPESMAVSDEDGELTFAELDARSDRLAWSLTGLQHGKRPRVGLLCRNHRGLITSLVACAKSGTDVVLFNTGMSQHQIHNALRANDVSVLIADDEFVPLAEIPGDVPLVTTTTGLAAHIASGKPRRHRPPPDSGRTIVLTSGTTGDPKGAKRPPPGLGSMTSMLSRIPLKVGDRIHIAAPVFHTWGYAALQLAMAMRAGIVTRRRFDPEDLLRTIDEQRCTVLFAVPVMLQRLLELPESVRRRYDTSCLRLVATSGSGYPADLATRFMDTFGDVLYNLYGSTEVSWISIATPPELRQNPSTSGRPPYGTRVLLLDADGREVATGQSGRIFVGNDMLFEGYTDGSRRSVHGNTMNSGDLGHRDESGLLFVDGRDDDMIVSGGENVFPSEVENLLARLPQVREVAVIGVADDGFGQRLAAHLVVEPGSELDAETVRQHVREHLARFSVPRDVHFCEALPRNATGKVVPRLLEPLPGSTARGRRITATLRSSPYPGRSPVTVMSFGHELHAPAGDAGSRAPAVAVSRWRVQRRHP